MASQAENFEQETELDLLSTDKAFKKLARSAQKLANGLLGSVGKAHHDALQGMCDLFAAVLKQVEEKERFVQEILLQNQFAREEAAKAYVIGNQAMESLKELTVVLKENQLEKKAMLEAIRTGQQNIRQGQLALGPSHTVKCAKSGCDVHVPQHIYQTGTRAGQLASQSYCQYHVPRSRQGQGHGHGQGQPLHQSVQDSASDPAPGPGPVLALPQAQAQASASVQGQGSDSDLPPASALPQAPRGLRRQASASVQGQGSDSDLPPASALPQAPRGLRRQSSKFGEP